MDLPLLSPESDRQPTLVVLRGNSASGKSTIAADVRSRSVAPIALVEQDYLRRIVLREPGDGETDGLNVRLIEETAFFALRNGYSALVEGILFTVRYAEMLKRLRTCHPGPSHFFYLDVSLAETARRHLARPQASWFTTEGMTTWYHQRDFLGFPGEIVLPETNTCDDNVAAILARTGWAV